MRISRPGVQAEVGPRQGDLFSQGPPALDLGAAVQRLQLDDRSWIDTSSRWLRGGDELLELLATRLSWTRARRPMYGQMVDEPRLGAFVRLDLAGSPPLLASMARTLAARYGTGGDSAWVNYYRGGEDSVAWHSDRIGIDPADAVVAIVSLGGPRRFLLRPAGGGPSRSFTLASGDLLVMGGACQEGWEHSVPKVAAAPPRMSVTFRRTAPSVL